MLEVDFRLCKNTDINVNEGTVHYIEHLFYVICQYIYIFIPVKIINSK